jgi:hypothetical protein
MFNATMLAVPKSHGEPRGLTVVTNDLGNAKLDPLLAYLKSQSHDVTSALWGQQCPTDRDIVVIMDMHNEQPFVHDMDEVRYQQFKEFIARNASSKILWVTGAAQIKCLNPRYGMLLGLARTIRTEYSAELATLELDDFGASSWHAV